MTYGVELIINESEGCIVVIEAADAYCAEVWVRQHLPDYEHYRIGDVKRFEEINK